LIAVTVDECPASEDQTNTAEQEDEPEPDYDIESYRHALEEARRTLDQQLDAFNDVNEKAWRIVQLNGLIATVYVSAVANAMEGLTFSIRPIILIISGLTMMAASVFLAASGQEAKTVTIGQGPEAFESLRDNDPSEIAYLYETLKDYESWIDQVSGKTEKNGETVNIAKWLSILGVVFISGGTVFAFVI
jgi:hypothetical protein